SEHDLPERLARYGGSANITRIALSHDDVKDDTDLPHFDADTKCKDPRYGWFVGQYGRRCFEIDALSPVVLRQRVEAEILARLDRDLWNHAVEIERVEVQSMNKFVAPLKSISGLTAKYSDGGAA
ncbi:MAG: hypothetical protein OEM00_10710, partial [Burkholderiaceae bacterium]|nr:hypothetical protein [Burkholderiaceae bacterium]